MAMAKKADFNAEEWETVVGGPVSAALLVAAAERGGTFRESLEVAKAYAEARQHGGQNALLDEIVSSPPAVSGARYSSAEELREASLQRVRDAVAVLSAKAEPADVEAYRDFVLQVAERVAQAHKEGGVLGIGGKRVSEAERQAIEAIKQALEG
jgi:hypothetical protein